MVSKTTTFNLVPQVFCDGCGTYVEFELKESNKLEFEVVCSKCSLLINIIKFSVEENKDAHR